MAWMVSRLTLAQVRKACKSSFFYSRTIANGIALSQTGRILEIDVEADGDTFHVRARVQGTAILPYDVRATLSGGSVGLAAEGQCTCPVGENCKHVVAALAAAASHDAAGSREGAFLDSTLHRWTAELAAPPAAPAARAIVCFVLSETGRSPPQLTLRILLAARDRAGNPGPARPFVPHPDGLAASLGIPDLAPDAHLLRPLFGEAGFRETLLLTGRFAAEILPQLLATGRTFWKQPSARPLALGPPRRATPCWREGSDGAQHATFRVDPPATHLFPLDPPWYFDKAARQCGPLEVAGKREAAARWLLAPPVAPEQAAAVAASLQQLALPAPRAIEVVDRRGVAPTPVLRLERVTFRRPATLINPMNWKRSTVDHLDVARVFFDYEGHRVAAGAAGHRLSIRTGNTLLQFHRNRAVEDCRLDEVRSSGLQPALSVFLSGFPSELQDAFALPCESDWSAFVVTMLPGARESGWLVEVDPSFPFRAAPVDDWYAHAHAPAAGEDWFGYELGIVVEGTPVNLLPFLPRILSFLKDVQAQDPEVDKVTFTLPDGRIVDLPAERLRAIAATFAELFDPDALADNRLLVSRLRAAELVNLDDQMPWRGPDELRALSQTLRAFNGIQPLAAPDGLRATLRPYQLDGLAWLQFLRQHQFGGILADDMGLGKTLQVLAHLLHEKNAGRAGAPSLVVAPTSLMAHWRAQAERFAPGLRTLILHGGGRKERFDRIPESDLVVTSYALLPRDQEILAGHAFHLLILDEAQYIKNPRTKAAEILRSLRAGHRLCMTGTPMENHLGELWSLMHFLSPGYLGSEKQFRRIYRDPIEKAGDADRRSALARRIRPFILRRRKEDVAAELPPKTEILRNVELDGDQRDLYETLRLAMHERVRAEVEKRGLSRAHIVILDALLKLRQVCCDPRLVKLERARKIKGSAKLELLAEMLPSMIAEGRRILLFSQFTSMLDLIEPELARLELPFVRLDGSTTDRETPVNAFQAGSVPLFLISLKAGGTGLNLTAADTVIHYDPWWNPAVERQATDRAHRIGQDKPVFVYKLVTSGTVEEKILAMQERKKELVNALLGEGAQQTLQLSREDLDHLFTPLA
jgi:hypothetical protein